MTIATKKRRRISVHRINLKIEIVILLRKRRMDALALAERTGCRVGAVRNALRVLVSEGEIVRYGPRPHLWAVQDVKPDPVAHSPMEIGYTTRSDVQRERRYA